MKKFDLFNPEEQQKVVEIFMCDTVSTPVIPEDRSGIGTHIIRGKFLVSVSVRTEDRV